MQIVIADYIKNDAVAIKLHEVGIRAQLRAVIRDMKKALKKSGGEYTIERRKAIRVVTKEVVGEILVLNDEELHALEDTLRERRNAE